MFLEITSFGETLMRRDMLRFADNLAVPTFALQDAATVLRAVTERQFDTEGGNSGGWAPLADSTLLERGRRARQGAPTRARGVTAFIGGIQDARILQATGRLKESLTRKFDPDHFERLSGDSLAFGSNVAYGGYHQTGTRKMPKRQPLALSEADKVALVKVMQEALLTGTRSGSARPGLAQLLGVGL